MTQEELRNRIKHYMLSHCKECHKEFEVCQQQLDILALINQHVKEVIGEDEKPDYRYFDGGNEFIHDRNHVREEQRKRAELTK